jgi:hypothetical protein
MTSLDPYDLTAVGSDSDDANRAQYAASLHDEDGPVRMGLDPYPGDEDRGGPTLNVNAARLRHMGTGLRSVHRARRAA